MLNNTVSDATDNSVDCSTKSETQLDHSHDISTESQPLMQGVINQYVPVNTQGGWVYAQVMPVPNN